MSDALTPQTADQIWTILVQEAGAHEADRAAFVFHQKRGCCEWRFQGLLGFGGKFWNNAGRWYVTCYSEDETPRTLEVVEQTNRRLESLRAGLVDNRLPA